MNRKLKSVTDYMIEHNRKNSKPQVERKVVNSVKPTPVVRLTKKWRDEARQEFFDRYGNWID